ncbi:MAG: hypothetical protein LBN99_08315, partial [Oscillospiraceae bacterium]|nr:hypothetical protein [Oscillospiraceae bacterium]
LLSGQFPVRLNPTFLNGYGYADAIMYPTLFLYFPAALRLLHVSLTVAYQLFIFAINLATAGLAYTCAKRLLRRRDLAIFLSAAYTLCLYRLICIFTRAAVGELIAMAFLPAVLLGMYEVFFGDEKRGRRWLILGFTGVVNSHVLSVEMAAVICLLFALANVRRLAELRRLAALLTSAIAVAALGAWVLVPMAHIGSTDLNVMHSFPNAAADAVYPAEMFATFVDALGLSGDLYAPYTGMPLSVGGILGIGALLFLFGRYLLRRDEDGEAARLGSLGLGGLKLAAVALFLASTLFPWTYISKIPGLGRLLVSVQFPWRWFCIASVALVLTLTAAVSYIARGSQNRRRAILVACALVVMASASPYIDGYMQNSGQTAALANKLAPLYSGHLGGQEYLRQGTAKSALESRPPVVEPSGEARVTRFSRDFTNAEFTYENAAPGDYAELPLYYYPGYAARDADGGALTVGAGENGVVRVDLPSGGGSVSVSYREPLSYRVSEIISLLALIILTALYLRSKIKVNKFLREE